jgi:hypothetical protein
MGRCSGPENRREGKREGRYCGFAALYNALAKDMVMLTFL